MNLDDLAHFRTVDQSNMLAEIDDLPVQLERAWQLGQDLRLPDWGSLEHIVIAGMGGSAIAGDLLAAYAAPLAPLPVMIWRDYDLPAFVSGPRSLVVLCSHSGNTEETLSAFESGQRRGAQMLAISTGGNLVRRAKEQGVPVWQFEHGGMPRAAVGLSFGLLLAAFHRSGLLPDPAAEVKQALMALRDQQVHLRAEVMAVHNPAKRMAGQFFERWPVIMGAGILAPVARRWRTQIAEHAKALAQFEFIPEADHNAVAGVEKPEELIQRSMVVFLRAASQHERNLHRLEATRKIFMLEGFNTDTLEAQGEGRLAQQWTALHFGDYLAYYLAMGYGLDPTPIPAIDDLKAQLEQG